MSLIMKILFKGDTTDFDTAIKHMQSKAGEFASQLGKTAMAGVGIALGATELKSIIEKTAEFAKSIHHASEQTGLTTDNVQLLTRAAKNVGLEFDNVAMGLSKFGEARKEAGLENGEMRREFEKLGVSIGDIRNPMLSNLNLIQKAFGSIGDAVNSEQRVFMRELFGRGGEKLIEVFRKFNDLKDSGTAKIISKEDIESIYEAEKALKGVGRELDRIKTQRVAWGLRFGQWLMGMAGKGLGSDEYRGADIGGAIGKANKPEGATSLPPGFGQGQIFNPGVPEQTEKEKKAVTELLEIYERIDEINRRGARTFGTFADKLLQIRKAISGADSLEASDGSIVGQAEAAKQKLDAADRLRALRQELGGNVKLNVNSLQAIGGKISDFGQRDMTQTIDRLRLTEQALIREVQNLTGQLGTLQAL